MKCLLIALALCFAAPTYADSRDRDYDFNQERMIVDRDTIFIISSFDSTDGVSAYDFYGNRLWETRFKSKILSWDVEPNLVLIFSKDRAGRSTFLNCIDRRTGISLWERP